MDFFFPNLIFPEASAKAVSTLIRLRCAAANLFANRDGRAGVRKRVGRKGGSAWRVDGGDTGWLKVERPGQAGRRGRTRERT